MKARHMSTARHLLFFSLLVFCAGCSKQQPGIRTLSESSVIVAFGDSLTFGFGAGKEESYPVLLSKMLKCRVINAGVSGEVTSSGLRRLPAVLKKARPDLVILCHGGNDMLRKQSQDATIENLSAMISLCQNAGSDVILLGVPRPALILRSAPFYRELATKHNIPLESDSISRILSDSSLKSDQIHPNARGYKQLAEALAALIRKSQKK